MTKYEVRLVDSDNEFWLTVPDDITRQELTEYIHKECPWTYGVAHRLIAEGERDYTPHGWGHNEYSVSRGENGSMALDTDESVSEP